MYLPISHKLLMFGQAAEARVERSDLEAIAEPVPSGEAAFAVGAYDGRQAAGRLLEDQVLQNRELLPRP